MFWNGKGVTLLVVGLLLAVVGMLPVYAENATENATVSSEEGAPEMGVAVFKYSPVGISMTQADGVTSSISEFAGHTLIAFTTDTNKTALSVDVLATNLTLEEINADILTKMESKKDFKLISEEETTLGGVPAHKDVFTYSPFEGVSKEVTQIAAVNNGNQYVIQTEAIDGDKSAQELGVPMIESFQFIAIADDNISKMVKSKFKKSAKPSKGYSIYSYPTYSTELDWSWYEGYHWDYVEEWCTCMVETIDYYCWCW
ncbi:MAG TPA: hypothetical protein VN372_01915 [Methanospirillum sp.]|nr:hypothetical protein [Methanospirillum sp.]